jgi:hypothetical protein
LYFFILKAFEENKKLYQQLIQAKRESGAFGKVIGQEIEIYL